MVETCPLGACYLKMIPRVWSRCLMRNVTGRGVDAKVVFEEISDERLWSGVSVMRNKEEK